MSLKVIILKLLQHIPGARQWIGVKYCYPLVYNLQMHCLLMSMQGQMLGNKPRGGGGGGGVNIKWHLTSRRITVNYQDMLSHDRIMFINSLWPSDTIWQQRSGSTLVQVMACCLIAPSHYLNQCWLIISEVQWHSYKGNFTRDASTIDH